MVKVPIVPSFSKFHFLGFFGKVDGYFEKKPLKTFGNADLRKFFFASCILPLLMSSQDVKNFGFLGKRDGFFRKIFESFQKHSTWILCFRKWSKSYSGLCNLKMSKAWDFSEKWCFFGKFLKVFRSTMLSIFDLECVSEFQIAEEISKQSNFWVFRRNRCLWKEPRIFSEIGKRGIFLLAYVSNRIIAQENSERSKIWKIPEKRRVNSKNRLNFFKIAIFGKIFIECVSKGNFALKLSKVSDLGFCWKNRWVFLVKKLDYFSKSTILTSLL